MEAILALEDGTIYRGRAFGASGERTGEVVFNTSMTGYQEILTDPSYSGQIVVMTCPQIGNVGTNGGDLESTRPQVEGFAVREVSTSTSNWRANQALHEYLREHGIPGITDVDTRAVTRRIRIQGAMKGILSTVDRNTESLVHKAREAPGLAEIDLVGRVTCGNPHRWEVRRDGAWAAPIEGPPGTGRRLRCVAYDFGVKHNILRVLQETGFDLTVVPASTPSAEALAHDPEVVFLSNGPGDPAAATGAIDAVRDLLGRVPIIGICLGHQIAALALGASTYKLKFGHRGGNHPVKDLRSGRVAITAQNHGYAVDPATLPPGATVTHRNLNDGTCEGFVCADPLVFTVQYHPESSPGPHDSLGLFSEFRAFVGADTIPVVGPVEGGT